MYYKKKYLKYKLKYLTLKKLLSRQHQMKGGEVDTEKLAIELNKKHSSTDEYGSNNWIKQCGYRAANFQNAQVAKQAFDERFSGDYEALTKEACEENTECKKLNDKWMKAEDVKKKTKERTGQYSSDLCKGSFDDHVKEQLIKVSNMPDLEKKKSIMLDHTENNKTYVEAVKKTKEVVDSIGSVLEILGIDAAGFTEPITYGMEKALIGDMDTKNIESKSKEYLDEINKGFSEDITKFIEDNKGKPITKQALDDFFEKLNQNEEIIVDKTKNMVSNTNTNKKEVASNLGLTVMHDLILDKVLGKKLASKIGKVETVTDNL